MAKRIFYKYFRNTDPFGIVNCGQPFYFRAVGHPLEATVDYNLPVPYTSQGLSWKLKRGGKRDPWESKAQRTTLVEKEEGGVGATDTGVGERERGRGREVTSAGTRCQQGSKDCRGSAGLCDEISVRTLGQSVAHLLD